MSSPFRRKPSTNEVIIPAHPGWGLIQWYFPVGGETYVDKGLHYDIDPIIGWGVTPGVSLEPRPICAFKVEGKYAIITPDGGVTDYIATKTFPSIEAWKHDLVKYHEEDD